MNIYDEVLRLNRYHRLVLARWMLRGLGLTYREKGWVMGRVEQPRGTL